jgi:hypothetical protein
MKTLTPQQIVDLNPCKGYDLKQVTELFDNRKSVTYLEILDTDKIPLWDIIWVFCQFTVLDKDIRNQWLEIIVTRAIKTHALHCDVDKVEEWAKNWLSGVDRTVVAARTAIHNIYGAARYAGYAARYAGYTAGCAANDDYDTAYDAVDVAAVVAAVDTATASSVAAADAATAADINTRNNEYKQQIQDLKDILQGEM